MLEFFKSYGMWFLLAGLFLFMFWGHFKGAKSGMDGGCCGTGSNDHDHDEKDSSDSKKTREQKPASGCH